MHTGVAAAEPRREKLWGQSLGDFSPDLLSGMCFLRRTGEHVWGKTIKSARIIYLAFETENLAELFYRKNKC